MKIGTVRPEEARVFDSKAGYHQFHSEGTQEPHGSFEVFWHDGKAPIHEDRGPEDEDDRSEDDAESIHEAGWYWWGCFPGCMPEGDAIGPFATSTQAHQDADEWAPEYADDE